MSPIGRVFIVLNLILASTFVVVSGFLLQDQADYKKQLADTTEKLTAEISLKDQQIGDLETQRGAAETAKATFQQQFSAAQVTIQSLQDRNKQLEEANKSNEANLKQLASLAESQRQDIKAAFDQSKAAYDASIAAQEARDEAVRLKDATVAENRDLNAQIAALNETVETRNATVASLTKDNKEKDLLIAVARRNGLVPSMVAPDLAGTVTMASDRLVTISVANNPGEVDIQEIINNNPFRIAIYDEQGYKAEAVATRYEPSANAILCNVMFKKDDAVIRSGDKARTKL